MQNYDIIKRVEPKEPLSITIRIGLNQNWQQEVGKGKISQFIKQTIEEKLQQEKEDLGKAYQECYSNNPQLLELAKKWEKAQNEDWINWEKQWNRKRKNGRKVN